MARKPAESKALSKYDAGSLDRPAGDRSVYMSNALARAAHGLTLGEKRIVIAAVAKLDSRVKANWMTPVTSKITAAEYAEMADCGLNAAYEALKTAAKNLYDRSITLFTPAHDRKGKPLGRAFGTVSKIRWVGRATYHEHEGWIELSWWHEVVPHLFGLQRQFTKYQLKQVSALRSVYSWKLLELLQRFEGTGWAEYTIEDFRASMETPPSLSDFGQIARRVIQPAVKELTEKDDWLIEWKPVKAGRRVKALRFKFSKNPQGRLL